MNKKKRLALVAGVIMTMSLSAGAAVLSGCGEQEDPNIQIETENLKTTYFVDKGANEYNVAFDGGNLTFSVAGDDRTGTFRYDGTNVTITFDNGEQLSAVIADGKLSFTYKEVNYEMAERKEYTVTFNLGGTTTTQEVVVGRTVAKPSDPVKANNIFLGWYEDSAFTKAFSFDTKITKNTTVYAHFVSSVSMQEEFTVSFDAEGQSVDSIQTINGKVYKLPELQAKGGNKFLGWWTSDSGSKDKLTAKCEEQTFYENTTLYAVWESDAPAVSVKSNGASWTAKGAGNSYTVDIFDEAGTSLLHRSGGFTAIDFDFASRDAGVYRVTVTLNGKTATAYYTNKGLARVSLFKVEGNVLIFNKVPNAQKYIIDVVCGDAGHNHIAQDLGTTAAFDFTNCEMRKGGITFKVKAVAEGYMTSESAEFAVERNLDAASVRVDEANYKVVWDAVEHATSYTLKINDGTTTTTVANLTATEYSIKEYTGNLTFTVTPVAHGYNSPDEAPLNYNKVSLPVPKNIRVTSTAIEWDAVDGATKYIVSINGTEKEITGTTVPISESDFAEGQTSLSFTIKVVGDSADKDSPFSDVKNITPQLGEENVRYDAGYVSWDPVIGASKYGIKVNDGEEIFADATDSSCEVKLTKAGVNVISVRSYNGETPSDWVDVTANAITVALNAYGGVTDEALYLSAGAPMRLPQATRLGYDFMGWYTAAEGGQKYNDGNIFDGTEGVVLHANWQAKVIDVTLDLGSNGILEDASNVCQVTFGQPFQFPTLLSKDGTKAFIGWAQYQDGTGTRYSDVDGQCELWEIATATTIYPVWLNDVLKFESISAGREYGVKQGTSLKNSVITKLRIPSMYNGKPVTTIEGGTFDACTNLIAIEIPDTIQIITMGDSTGKGSAFGTNVNMKLERVDVYHVEGNNESIFFSDEYGVLYKNNPNTKLVDLVYFPQAKSDDYVIPDGVSTIPAVAFKGRLIESITIPVSVTEIGQSAFESCKNLKDVIFLEPDDGEESKPLTIKKDAFKMYSGYALTAITISSRFDISNVSEVFNSAQSLVKIYAPAGSDYSDIDGVLCVNNGNGKTIVYCPRGRSGPYVIDGTVTEIGEEAFYQCTNITKLTVPATVRVIGERAFYGCNKIDELKFTAEKADYIDYGRELTIKEEAFYQCTKIGSLTLPAHLVSLGANAFGAISGLTTVNVDCVADKDDITFSNQAFANKTGTIPIKKVIIGKDVATFDITGVFGAASLSSVEVDPENVNYEAEDGVLFNYGKTEILYYPNGKFVDTYVLPDTVQRIGDRVFYNKLNLEKIKIGGNVTYIGVSAFEKCQSLTEVEFEMDRTKSLTIADSAFKSCSNVLEWNLPTRSDSLTDEQRKQVVFTMGEDAFSYCSKVTSFTVPEGFTEIGKGALYMLALEELHLPSTLEKLCENKIEAGKTEAEPITLLELITVYTVSNGTSTLYYPDNTKLATVTIPASCKNYTVIDGVLYKKNAAGDAETLLLSPQRNGGDANHKVTVPSTVTKILDNAFYASQFIENIQFTSDGSSEVTFGDKVFGNTKKLSTIALPGGMKEIGARMFYQSAELSKISIPKTVAKIGSEAFYGCKKLSIVEFEDTNPGEKVVDLVFADAGTVAGDHGDVYQGIFEGCTFLKTLEFPARTTTIGSYCCYNVTSLQTVSIPGAVTSIGNNAFSGCKGISSLTFEDGYTGTAENPADGLVIGTYAFRQVGTENGEETFEVTLPAHLKTLGEYAFNAAGLTSVTIPSFVETVGKSAFYSNKALTTVEFGEGIGIETLDTVFSSCIALDTINLEDCTSLTTLTSAFKDCSNLEAIEIPSSVTTIGANTFSGCTSLSSITFQTETKDGVTACNLASIGDTAFEKTAFTQFTFPKTFSVSGIALGKTLFKNCTKLGKVIISDSISNLGTSLKACKSLSEIEIAESNTKLKAIGNWIVNTNGTTIQQVLGAVSLDKDEDNNETDGVFTIPEGFTEIGANAFEGQSVIKKLVLPTTMQKIGDYAFRQCRRLEEVVIQGTALTSIGQYAFANCYSLNKININAATNTNLTIGNYVFAGCISLTSISLPDSVKTIGTYTFLSCSGLTTAYVPTVAGNMFEECRALTTVTLGTRFSGTISAGSVFKNCKALKTVKYKDSSGTVHGDENVVTIPATVNTLSGASFFIGCTSITKVVFEDRTSTTDKLTLSGGSMFSGCTLLTTVEFPKSKVDKLSAASMFVDTGVTSLILPSDVTQLGNTWFVSTGWSSSKPDEYYDNGFLNMGYYKAKADGTFEVVMSTEAGKEEVLLPASLVNLGTTFQGTRIKKITVPSSVTTIANSAFAGCRQLVEAEVLGWKVSSSKKYTASSMFEYCIALEKVTLNEELQYIDSSTFKNCKALRTILCKDTSKETDNLRGSEDVVTLPSLVYYLGSSAFEGCIAITEADLSTLKSHSGTDLSLNTNKWFYGCTALVKVTVNKTLTFQAATGTQAATGAYSLFEGCTNLTTMLCYDDDATDESKRLIGSEGVITLPAIQKGGNSMFEKCTSITTVDMTMVASNAFERTNSVSDMNEMFLGCTKLQTVIIPKTLTHLSQKMFSGCTALKTIKQDDGVDAQGNRKYIGSDNVVTLPALLSFGGYGTSTSRAFTFINCSGITSLDLSLLEGFATYDEEMFSGCTGIQSVILNDNITSLYASIFKGCSKLTTLKCYKVTQDGENVTTTIVGNDNEITLPSGLQRLSANAFEKCSSITKVVLNENITELPTEVFWGCTKLTDIDVSKITSFGEWALQDCSTLSNVTLNENITSISEGLFSGCAALTDIVLPDNVTSIGDNAFEKTGIISITLPDNLKTIGANAFANTDITSIVIPEGVTTIGNHAFLNCPLYSFTVPDSVTSIGGNFLAGVDTNEISISSSCVYAVDENGFVYNKDTGVIVRAPRTLPEGANGEVVIPEGTQLGAYALNGCYGITKLYLSADAIISSNSLYGFKGEIVITGGTEIINSAFYNNKGITKVTLCEGIKTIGQSAFRGCGITEIVLPESLEKIDLWAFWGTAISKITIPKNVTSVGAYAFTDCINLTEVTINGNLVTGHTMFAVNSSSNTSEAPVEKIIFGEGVTEINDYLLKGCNFIETIIIPKTLKAIGKESATSGVFESCTKLKTILISDGVDELGNPKYIGNENEVTLPEGFEYIGYSAFKNCTSIEKVILPSTLKHFGSKLKNGAYSVGGYVFSGCSSLTEVVIPDGVELEAISGVVELQTNNFANSAIEQINIPSNIERISSNAFFNCKALTSVELPEGLLDIGTKAFSGSGLTEITIPGKISVELIPGTTKAGFVGESAFEGCESLETVVISEGVISLEKNYIFRNCTALTSITLPESLETVGPVFVNCIGITNLVIPANVNKFGSKESFAGMTKEQTITIQVDKIDALVNTTNYSILDSCGATIVIEYVGATTTTPAPDSGDGAEA